MGRLRLDGQGEVPPATPRRAVLLVRYLGSPSWDRAIGSKQVPQRLLTPQRGDTSSEFCDPVLLVLWMCNQNCPRGSAWVLMRNTTSKLRGDYGLQTERCHYTT